MSVLDELREALLESARFHQATPREVCAILDAFEVAHPGIEDRTILCDDCGTAMAPEDAVAAECTRCGAQTLLICPACAKSKP